MPNLQHLLDQIHQIEKHTRPGPWELHPVNDSQLYAAYIAGAEADPLEPEIAAVVSGFDAQFIALARTALPAMSKALRAVLELHRKTDHQRAYGFPRADKWEHYCIEDDQSWPCATVQAITDALEADDA